MSEVQTSIGDGFKLHVNYMDPPPSDSGPVVISVSNPDVATVEENPQFPSDPMYAIIMPAKLGGYVVSAYDGVFRGSLPEMEVVGEGVAPPLPDQIIILA